MKPQTLLITPADFPEYQFPPEISQIRDDFLTTGRLENFSRYTNWILLLPYPAIRGREEEYLERISSHHPFSCRFILLSDDPEPYLKMDPEFLWLALPERATQATIRKSVENCAAFLSNQHQTVLLQSQLELSYQDVQNLTRVGQAMASEHDFDRLIDLILTQARKLTSADGGSIYLVERRENHERPTHLRFKKSALNLHANEFLLPMNADSIAGYVGMTGEHLFIDDVYSLTGKEPYKFNDDFDRTHNYHTKSMMVIPMKNHHDEVIGVIQLINRKKNFNKVLTAAEMAGNEVLPFDEKSYELGMSFAGQAAVALENNLLILEIHNLFEGFVKASVTAIEQRDPTTSGHSFRVAEFTSNLALAVDRISNGDLAPVKFSRAQMREIRYASLLHDFGKVGVREQVLVKPKKLYDHELQLIQWRFRTIFAHMENELLRKKLELYRSGVPGAEIKRREQELDQRFEEKRAEVAGMLTLIEQCNEPSIREEGDFEFLRRISGSKLRLNEVENIPFLKENELLSLSIRRGSLNQEERKEIESHVVHTYSFLSKIPWTSDLKNVPDIAYGHHEKLDGTGYPLQLGAEKISVQSRMMTISDIFDALTAWDRPYKKAIPHEKAFDILYEEARSNHVDKRLLDIFVQSGAFRLENEVVQA